MEFHFRMYGVSRRMCYVRVTYVWRIKCTRDVSTAYLLSSIRIKKRSTSAYVEYELRIEEYQLRMLTYARRTRDVPFVS